MAIRAHAKQLEIATFVHPDVPTWVSGDPTRLRQVLVNLVGNAIKFTEQGEVVLRVEPNQADPAHTPSVARSPTPASGFQQAKLTSIFERFTQVDSSTTRKYGGTGLGLSISKQLGGTDGGPYRRSTAREGRRQYLFVRRSPSESPSPAHRITIAVPLISVTAASLSSTTTRPIA